MNPPPAPNTPVVTADDETASIEIAVTVPAAGAGQSAASWVDIYRSEDGGWTSIRIAKLQAPTGVTVVDYTPTSHVDYAYRAIAYALDGTSSPASEFGGLDTADIADAGPYNATPADLRDGGSPAPTLVVLTDGGAP